MILSYKFKDSEQLYENELKEFRINLLDGISRLDGLNRLYNTNGEILGSDSLSKVPFFEAVSEDKSKFKEAIFLGDCVKVDGEYMRFVRINNFGIDKEIPFNYLGNLHDSFIVFRKIPKERSKRLLDLKRRTSFSGSLGTFSNPTNQEGYSSSELLISEIVSGREHLWEFEFWFVIRSQEERELNDITKNLLFSLEQASIDSSVEVHGLNYTFLHYCGKESSIIRPHVVHGSFLINILPLTYNFVMGEGYEFDCLSNQKINFNIFNEKSNSYSAIVTGPPGSGKSMLANKLFKEEVERGAKGVILDKGGSYKKLISYLGGRQLKGKINPFISNDPFYIRSLILSIIGDEFSSLEKKKLLGAIKNYNSDFSSIEDLINVSSEVRSDLKFAFSEIENHLCESKINLSDVTYVDFDDFESCMIPFVLVYVLESFNNLDGKKVMIMDECHGLLKNNSEYVETRFRELRKKMGSPIAISQSFDDFIRTDVGRIIAENAYYKFFFNQNIRETEFINEEDRKRIESLKTRKGLSSEFYLKSDLNKKILIFNPTNLEYELFTSDYSDNLFFNKFYENNHEYYEFKDIVHKLVEFKYV